MNSYNIEQQWKPKKIKTMMTWINCTLLTKKKSTTAKLAIDKKLTKSKREKS